MPKPVKTTDFIYEQLLEEAQRIGFSMITDKVVGQLLRSLSGVRGTHRILELGTGIGSALVWILDGMQADAQVITIDNDPSLIKIVQQVCSQESRVEIICADANKWLKDYDGASFDLIFADTWAGKYEELERVLEILAPGGVYVIDDMLPQPNWPEGHKVKVDALMDALTERPDLSTVTLHCGSGIMIATKRK